MYVWGTITIHCFVVICLIVFGGWKGKLWVLLSPKSESQHESGMVHDDGWILIDDSSTYQAFKTERRRLALRFVTLICIALINRYAD